MSGVHTFTVSHSSDVVTRIGCGGGGPNSDASRTPFHGSCGTGAAKRSGADRGLRVGNSAEGVYADLQWFPVSVPARVATMVMKSIVAR